MLMSGSSMSSAGNFDVDVSHEVRSALTTDGGSELF